MDLNLITNKLNAINQVGKRPNQGEKIDYTKYFWKPQPGKHQIRILPSKVNKANPFREVFFHYGFAKGPVLALSNWGESDPIIEFAQKLRQTKDRDNWILAKKVEPKMRVFVPVVVRGEEEKGARLWEFGQQIYKTLLGIAADEDYGDFTDIADGRDFTIDADYTEVAGRRVVGCTVRVKPKTTPISEDPQLVEKWLNDQPDILTINKKREYDDIKSLLEKWLNPDEEETQTVTPSQPQSQPQTESTSTWNSDNALTQEERKNFQLNVNPTDKFDELFND